MAEPQSSNFRVITTNCLGVRIFRKFTVFPQFTVTGVIGQHFLNVLSHVVEVHRHVNGNVITLVQLMEEIPVREMKMRHRRVTLALVLVGIFKCLGKNFILTTLSPSSCSCCFLCFLLYRGTYELV